MSTKAHRAAPTFSRAPIPPLVECNFMFNINFNINFDFNITFNLRLFDDVVLFLRQLVEMVTTPEEYPLWRTPQPIIVQRNRPHKYIYSLFEGTSTLSSGFDRKLFFLLFFNCIMHFCKRVENKLKLYIKIQTFGWFIAQPLQPIILQRNRPNKYLYSLFEGTPAFIVLT